MWFQAEEHNLELVNNTSFGIVPIPEQNGVLDMKGWKKRKKEKKKRERIQSNPVTNGKRLELDFEKISLELEMFTYKEA